MKDQTRKSYEERILRVLVHLQNHLDEDLSHEDLARIAFFSPFHFHRVFKGMVGESLGRHLRRLRLERAAQRLKRPGKTVLQVALEAGYSSPEAFTRAFKEMFGVTPSRFRSSRNQSLPRAPSGVHYRPGCAGEGFTPLTAKGETMKVEIRHIPSMKVAFVRHVGPYDQVGSAWDRLMTWAGPKGLLGPGVSLLGLCYDDPDVTPPEKLRYDACLTVEGDVAPEGEIGVQETLEGKYAVTIHTGPYEKLGETYAFLCGRWAPGSGRELRSAPCLEFYLNDPDGTEPEELATRVCVPLGPKR